MSVKVTLIGRLGNNLFGYALGRIIAQQLRMELDCRQEVRSNPWRFAGKSLDVGISANLSDLREYFPNAPLHIEGRRFDHPIDRFELRPNEPWRGQRIDLQSVLENQDGRQVRLKGFFQRTEYYSPHKAQLREWFRPIGVKTPAAGHADVVLNIRRGADFGLNDWILPASYYLDALSRLREIGDLYVCGTCIDQTLKDALSGYRPLYYEASPIEHFAFMMSFRRIVLSNSTFAWWAAFLSAADQIYAPRFASARAYSFSGFGDIDLHMHEDRYNEITVGNTVRFALLTRNAEATSKMTLDGHRLHLETETMSRIIQLNESQRSLVSLIAKQDKPIVVGELYSRFGRNNVSIVLNELVSSDVFFIRPTYIET
jgi:hypothetical protein